MLKPLPQKAGEPLTKLDWLMSAAMVPPGGSKNAKKAEAKMADKFSHLAKAVKGKEWFHFDCVGLNPMQQMDIDEKPFYC